MTRGQRLRLKLVCAFARLFGYHVWVGLDFGKKPSVSIAVRRPDYALDAPFYDPRHDGELDFYDGRRP